MSFPTISIAINGFFLHLSASGRSHHTLLDYKNTLDRFAIWMNNKPVNEVKNNDLERFIYYLKNDFRITHIATTSIPPRKLSQKTLANTHGTLSSFWRWVSREFEIENPFRIAPIRAHTKPIAPLKAEEIERLMKACHYSQKTPEGRKAYQSNRNTYKRDRVVLLTLLDTGIRVSELCGISVKDIDLESGRILVTGKGNKSRFVYLGKISRQAVWSYISHRYPSQTPPLEDPLFTDSYEIHRLTPQGVLILLKRLGKKAGVVSVHPHKFRHTFAVEFLRNGGNVFELQQLLGHSSLDMVKRYVMIAQLDLEIVARRTSPADHMRLR